MCLSFPARIIQVADPIAFVDYGNSIIEPVLLNGFEDLKEGDYVVVSYGMIMEKISEEEFKEILKYEEELARVVQNV
ncbi:HypC/HybG/HupF family hydrogenase formation chaperone [Metallosphaera javensis (ex Sakai et al. 2022)]|uniref:HypC/HybG/HupF family hydrogenase formation chaperone n=1 Tax=Metallosphaera javensis (ex Sakai et al. 2022) TaxID=2775498 RepID=UPI00258F015F|nr:MAG: [NiFe] hydrogenase metallocenter assembly protein HypC [Metallosphaera javensis (ex Sakai et al. 2022)]